MVDEGFVVHLADEHRFGLGVAAFEVGSGYSRQEPLQRIARRLLADLVDETGQSAHLAVLHGRDVLYVCRGARPGPPAAWSPTSGSGCPAHLTASGRAILAALPAAQVRALYPDRAAFVDRPRHRPGLPERAARPAVRDPAARPRGRGRRGHARVRQRRRGGARPHRLPGRPASRSPSSTDLDPPEPSPTPYAAPPAR